MIKDIEGLVDEVVQKIRSHMDLAVLGMSGGADSTLCAILCRKALGAEQVFNLHMPYGQRDEEFFNARSRKTAQALGINIMEMPVTAVSDAIQEGVTKVMGEISQLNAGNCRSRARMTFLYGVCHEIGDRKKLRARVVGTGNLSEDAIGFDTKGGDALCDVFIIGELFKSEVYQLLDYFRDQGEIDESMIDRVPSPGLWDGHTDEEELGMSYNEMEPSVRKVILNGQKPEGTTDIFVHNRHQRNKHKHEAPAVVKLRQFCD